MKKSPQNSLLSAYVSNVNYIPQKYKINSHNHICTQPPLHPPTYPHTLMGACQKDHIFTGNKMGNTVFKPICVFFMYGIPQLIVYLPHTDKYISHSSPTSNDWSRKARWKWRTVERLVSWACGAVTWHQHCVEVQTSQSEALLIIHGHMFAVPFAGQFQVFTKCVWPSSRCSQCLHEASRIFVKTSQSY